MRIIKALLSGLLMCGLALNGLSQKAIFQSSKSTNQLSGALSDYFHQVDVFEMEGTTLRQRAAGITESNFLELHFGDRLRLELELYPTDMFAENALIRVLTESGEMFHPVPRNISFKGHVKNDPQQQVSLLIHNDYIYAHISNGLQRTYIVSANRFVKNAASNQYLIYDRSDVKQEERSGTCGMDTYPEFDFHDDHAHERSGEARMTGICYDVDLGIVSDYSLFTDKGSTIQGAIDHAVGVMMDVEGDYETADFDDALEFEILEQVISTCSECDQWTDSTDPGDLLSEFSAWVDNGFNQAVDMGQFWTNRNFDGSTVGLAYRAAGLLCNAAHHVLEDFTSDADLLRVMTSHEIGHNLNATHDVGAGDIMASSVSNTNTWSATSVSTIDGIVDAAVTATCLTTCVATPCDPVTDVSITGVSATGFTISWTATTESAYRVQVRDEEDKSIIYTDSPISSGSMTISPAGWEICHDYMVMVENDCGSSVYSAPVSSLVKYTAVGCAEFSADENLEWGSLTVNFVDESVGATSWSWTFGDGNSSTAQNPSNTYSAPGVYAVSLSVNAGAHTNTKSGFIYVLPTGTTLPYATSDGGDMDNEDFGTKSTTSGKTSLFERGVASNYFSSTGNAWVTDLDGDVLDENNEMALYSPDFDFSDVSAATLSFDLGMEVTYANGPFAVQVQYSTNGGSSWTKLGADTDTDWYNRGPSKSFQISSSIFTDEMGFTTTSSSGTSYTYNIDALAGNSSVIFRFAFNVMTGFPAIGYSRAGAMIDNFAISATVLPAELVNFEGQRIRDAVELTWTTASEEQNDYFIVERSRDGFQFEEISKVEGQGDSFTAERYLLKDPAPREGLNYYRLTQVDYDGQKTIYDRIVVIDFSKEGVIFLYPNPTQGNQIQLNYTSTTNGDLQVKVYDTAGKLVKHFDLSVTKDLNVFELSLDGLSRGVYFIDAIQGNQTERLRFVKI